MWKLKCEKYICLQDFDIYEQIFQASPETIYARRKSTQAADNFSVFAFYLEGRGGHVYLALDFLGIEIVW